MFTDYVEVFQSQGLTNRVRGVLENSKFSYLRTPYIYILYVHDHHLSSLLVREETLKSSRTCPGLVVKKSVGVW